MNCSLEIVGRDGERFIHRCTKCGREVRHKSPEGIKATCGKHAAGGPGTELLRLFSELHVTPTKNCGCVKYARKMDGWGVAGCVERRAEILAHLESKSSEFGLAAWLTAGWQAVRKGLPKSLAGLVDLAIERASLAAPSPIPSGEDASPGAPLRPTT